MKICYGCMKQVGNGQSGPCPHCGYDPGEAVDTAVYLRPGTVLNDKYLVGKALGYGGFGITYIGWDRNLSRKVCIKEYFPRNLSRRVSLQQSTVTVAEKEQADRFQMGLRQFLEEARSLANLANVKGIVKIHSFFEANHTGYIIMEYLEGQDVKGMLKIEGGKLAYEKAEYIILTVLHTLNEIHKKNVLHRDIAPDNIFITNEGVIKLIDFGAAKHAAAQANMNAEILLKEGYAPLEQYRRDTRQGTYTDIYAVAALFYRMLTGKKPPSARSRFKQDTLRSLSEMGVQAPEYAEMAIMTSLNLQPQHRIQTAYEFMEALGGADFVPRYEPEWILPHVEEPGNKRGMSGFMEKFGSASIGVKAAVFLCLLAAAGGGGYGISRLASGDSVEVSATGEGTATVSQLEGRALAEVKDELEHTGIADIKVTYVLSEAPKDTVIAQSKAAGSIVDTAQDGSMELTVSGGSQFVTLGSYVQKSLDEAKKAAEADRVPYDVSGICSNDQPKGTVYDQSVAPGEVFDVTAGTLTLSVSRGAKSDFDRTIPDLSGKTVEQAKKILEELGLDTELFSVKTEKETGYNDSVSEGKISRQSVPEGQKVNLVDLEEHAKTITLYTSRGPKPTPEPTARPAARPADKPAAGSSGSSSGNADSAGDGPQVVAPKKSGNKNKGPSVEAGGSDYGSLW